MFGQPMKITVTKADDDAFELVFGDTEIALDGAQLKSLLIEITGVLSAGGGAATDIEKRTRAFILRIKNADDLGIQKLIAATDHEDVLVLLKTGEDDEALLEKFYGNMSERSRKIFAEDLIYKFKEGVSSAAAGAAVHRLARTVAELEEEGSLVFENPAPAR